MNRFKHLLILMLSTLLCLPGYSQKKKPSEATPTPKADSLWVSGTFSGLKFRNIGPATTSGRIVDIAVNPNNADEYYLAVACGGVWKTENHGTTYSPIFDDQASYSIGCISLAPSNPKIVWVGSGENNGQRSVSYGDGVYKSEDGGKSWKNMGLGTSEHIGKIIIHPTNPDIVWVAAQGPLWKAGGDRGLYKTTDGGKSWKKTLDISENTGVSDIVMDPRNPDVLIASTWQRRRHVYTLVSGGPESAVYKSTDGGETWSKSMKGLPGGDVGRIGLAISPVDGHVVYAIVETSGDKGGFFRSNDLGASWSKQSGTSTSGNYYQEIFCDPVDVDRVYIMDTYAKVTNDGGKTVVPLGEKDKHVDNHAIWIEPSNPKHYLIGCDGGLYESWDKGTTWQYRSNLPITQFYRVAADNTEPFYFVYGGTQDNYSLGGPSRTLNATGVTNLEWFVTNGGDGFVSKIDPANTDIVYAESQYGGLVRFDKKNGESVFIQPQPGKNEAGYRWNWDAPFLISTHDPQRLYFAANKVFSSNDRGDSWETISPDLSQQIDRNLLPVMGQVWSIDAVAKNASTSIFGNIVSLSESPKVAGLLYAGTDDGLIQITEDDGKNWRKIASFPAVPETTYVSSLRASMHNDQVVYAAFDNHKNGDFAPYLLRSSDRGKTWTSISSNLPKNGSVYCLEEDPVNPNLLFCGTEYGVFFTADAGKAWVQLKSGLPTIAIRDMDIQERENDLVLASFGRGFYILDDYTPLRSLTPESLKNEMVLFPVKDALMFEPATPFGSPNRHFQGASLYMSENPPVAATFTFYQKEGMKTRKQQRMAEEKKLTAAGKPVPYPSFEALRAEAVEESPYLLFTIRDQAGKVVRKLKTGADASGIRRFTWDLKHPAPDAISLSSRRGDTESSGDYVLPGTYSVEIGKVVDGAYAQVAAPVSFKVKSLENYAIPVKDRTALARFESQVADLVREVDAASSKWDELSEQVKYLQKAAWVTPAVPDSVLGQIEKIRKALASISITLKGDAAIASREFETAPSLEDRIGTLSGVLRSTTTGPSGSQLETYNLVKELLPEITVKLDALESEITALGTEMNKWGAPYTPGRKLYQD